MKEVTILIPDGKKAEWVNGILTLFDEPKANCHSVTERIKTVEDALSALGTPDEEIADFFKKFEPAGKDVVAYMKLKVIAEALNEGWVPQFTKDECHYFPWFRLYTKDEYEKMNAEQKSHCVLRSDSGAYISSGFVSVNTNSDASSSHTFFGSQLAFKNSNLAIYAGKQFIEEWADFMFKPHT